MFTGSVVLTFYPVGKENLKLCCFHRGKRKKSSLHCCVVLFSLEGGRNVLPALCLLQKRCGYVSSSTVHRAWFSFCLCCVLALSRLCGCFCITMNFVSPAFHRKVFLFKRNQMHAFECFLWATVILWLQLMY